MNYLFLALLLPQLSLQLPYLTAKDTALQPRAESVHSFDLSRITLNATSDATSASDVAIAGTIRDVKHRSKYLFPVTVEGHTFQMEMDTGSSDTWIIKTGFACYTTYDVSKDTFSAPLPQSSCNFGPTYTPGAGFKVNSTLTEISGYGGGDGNQRYVHGSMGKVSISIGDITVQQLIGNPDKVSQHCPVRQSG